MGITKIPEQTIITCDLCGMKKDDRDYRYWSMSGSIHMSCAGLDYQGAAVGPGEDSKYIFCNGCYREISERVRWCIQNPIYSKQAVDKMKKDLNDRHKNQAGRVGA